MSEHTATLFWKRDTPDFDARKYSRDHTWTFDGGVELTASAAPAFLGNSACVDPEEAFVASLASCHMLTFLYVAARKRFVVDSYRDCATGHLEKDAGGKLAITRVVLRPEIQFSGEQTPSDEELAGLHETAHEECFVARSVKTEVTVEPAVRPS